MSIPSKSNVPQVRMDTESEPYRPALHFAPDAHWINDPNGLIRVGRDYHMFYQYYPDGVTHGPMHWGHAISRDLVKWRELDIALHPDALGQCFSGSAVFASEGSVAAELDVADGEILLFYTAHLPREGTHPLQTQCLAIGNRDLSQFRRIKGNPIVPNPGLRAFRDPKVIWHAPTKSWVMVVTHGQSVGFYLSDDALNWRFASEFGVAEGRHGAGPWECPDLLSIVDENGDTYWVLVVGLGDGHVTGGSGTQYFIGQFDGVRFTNSNAPSTEMWMDWGRDFYAAQSFAGLADEAPLALAWASNWDYAQHTKTSAFRGVMSLPRRLAIVRSKKGPRLRQWVDETAAAGFPPATVNAIPGINTHQPIGGTYRLTINWDPDRAGTVEVCLFGEEQPQFVIVAENGQAVLRVRRAQSGVDASRGPFESDFTVAIDVGEIDGLELFVDGGLVEASLCNGMIWVTMLFFPAETDGPVKILVSP